MKTITLKLGNQQLKRLEDAARANRIPMSTLIRRGINLVLEQLKSDIVSADFRREVDAVLRRDHQLLKRLGKQLRDAKQASRFRAALETVNRRHAKTLKRLASMDRR